MMLLVMVSTSTLAQNTTIEVGGTVNDALSGAPVASARITLLDPTSSDTIISSVFTDLRGRYAVNVPTSVGVERSPLPEEYRLYDVYPTPVEAGRIAVRYATPANRPETPTLEVYDILGRRMHPDGVLAAGVYFYRLRFDRGHVTGAKRFVLASGGRVTLRLEQVRVGSSRSAASAGKQGGRAVTVRFVVEKAGFKVLDALRQISGGDANVHDFTLEREAGSRARLALRVTDATGTPLAGVTADVVDDTLDGVTNAFGEVILDSVYTGVPVVVRLSGDGYTQQVVRTEVPPGRSVQLAEAVMQPRATPVVLPNAEDGGAVQGIDGAHVTLPANGLVHANGDPVSGAVDVSLTSLDVTADGALDAFPGAFAGTDASGAQKLLMTLGVTDIVIEQDGQVLDLAEGRTATIELPLYTTKNERGEPLQAGDSIPLWWLDEATGLWVQETVGTVVQSTESPTGLALRGEVSHFSAWNCDVATDAASVTLTTTEALPEYSVFSGRMADGSLPAFQVTTQGVGSIAVSVEGSTFTTFIPPAADVELSVETPPRVSKGGLQVCTWSDVVHAEPNEEVELDIDLQCGLLDEGGDDELLAVPTTVERAIDPAGEVDTYRFEGASGMGALVSVCRPAFTSSLSGTVTLRAPSGLTLDRSEFGSFCGRITADMEEAGLYAVEIDGTFGEPGAYDLELDAGPIMPLSSPTSATFDGAAARNRHFFRPEPGDVISLAYGSDAVNGFVGGSVDLYDEGLGSVNFSASDGQFSQAAFLVEEDRPHVLELEVGSGVSGDYIVTALRLADPMPAVLDGAVTDVSGTIAFFGERRFYGFAADAGRLLNIVLDLSDARTQLTVKRPSQPFYDVVSHANVAHEAGAVELDTGPFLLTESGEWVVEIAHPSRAFPGLDALLGDYTFRVYAPETESLETDSTYHASLDDPFSFDAYAFTLDRERTVSIQTTLVSGEQLAPRLLDASGSQIAQTFLSSSGAMQALEGTVPAGDYYIVQDPAEGSVEYTMRVTLSE